MFADRPLLRVRHQSRLKQFLSGDVNIPDPVLIPDRSIVKLGYLPITISRILVGDYTAGVHSHIVLHAGATHEHKRGARFPGNLLRHFTDCPREQ